MLAGIEQLDDQALLAELMKRYDHALFIGTKPSVHEAGEENCVRLYSGEWKVIAGLAQIAAFEAAQNLFKKSEAREGNGK